MALRVLSGMLFINNGPKRGRAVITFNPLRLATAPGTVSLKKARTAGADGDFTRTPASIVAARQFAILDTDSNYKLRIGDTVTTTSITISWSGRGPTFSEEIPFMVVGSVPEPAAPVPRRAGGRTGRRRTSRR